MITQNNTHKATMLAKENAEIRTFAPWLPSPPTTAMAVTIQPTLTPSNRVKQSILVAVVDLSATESPHLQVLLSDNIAPTIL